MVALKKVQGGVRGQSPSLSNIGNKRQEKKKLKRGAERERRKKERKKSFILTVRKRS